MKELVRTHVLLPRPLVEAVDTLVGQRRRSRFVEDAVEEKLARERQLQALRALKASAGVLADADYPEWATPEKTSAWVHNLRQEADARTRQKLSRAHDEPSA
jgi:metal-responsive CopG/Arc/MetJ family transcriptional regulator